MGSYSYAIPLTAIYAAAGVILAGLAVIFFRRRRMEAAGETVAVPALRPLFRWGLAAVGALGMALLILKTVFDVGAYGAGNRGTPARVAILLLAMLFGAAVGWFGADALMRKTLRVFDRHWKGLGVFCALLCALVIGCELDVFGVERYQPEVDEIGYAAVNGWGEYDVTRIMQPENLEALLSLQKDIIANKKAYERQQGPGIFPLTIEYYGTDGKLLARRVYTYATDEYIPYVTGGNYNVGFLTENDAISQNVRQYEELLNSRELMEERALFPCDRSETAVFAAYIQWYHSASPVQQGITLTTDEFWELYDTCIVPDLRDGNIGGTKIIQDEEFYQALEPIYITATGVHTDSDGQFVYDYYTVRPVAASVRTNAWLRSHGVTVQTLGELNNVELNGSTDVNGLAG